MTAAVYRDLDDVPAIPPGFALYRADMVSGVPNDDLRASFSRWVLAPNRPEAMEAFERWATDANEGIVVELVEREDVL